MIVTGQGDAREAAIKSVKKKQRYYVRYGDLHAGAGTRYCLYDIEDQKVVFADDAKSSVISEAQRRNEFEPVDGSEQTYGRQIRNEEIP